MTALAKYARLETSGLWRARPDDQRREVVVSFGEASLVLTDPRSNEVISHWSLPAIERRNPGTLPALYAPGPDPDFETLELDDSVMIEAIETVRGALARGRPRRGRLRFGVTGTVIAALVLGGIFWLPDAVIGHSARVVPMVKRQEVGQALLASMTRFTGPACNAPEGRNALKRLAQRLFPGDDVRLVVVRDGLGDHGTTQLPGRLILIDRRLVETHDSPEVLAGHLLAQRARADAADPFIPVMQDAGLRATFTLLATGNLPPAAIESQARQRLQADTRPIAAEDLLPRFAAARLPATPYADSLPADDVTARRLRQDDPVLPGQARQILPDADWLALQAVCSR